MDIRITRKNGQSFTFSEHGIIVKDFLVSSIPILANYGQVEGADGVVDYGATYGQRTITVPFAFESYDLLDFPLFRDFLFDLVISKESFYIQELRRAKRLGYKFVDINEPSQIDSESDNQLLGGKRYLVRLQNTFDLEQESLWGQSELVFETTELPFAESIGTTQLIQANGVNANDELWGYGMGILADDESQKYTNTSSLFRIYNAGNIPVHPFQQDLRIELSGINGSGFTMENLTTGDKFVINDSLVGTDTFVIDGADMTHNGIPALRKTNRRYISLARGWNEIRLNRTAKTVFDFRYYYS